MASTINGTSTGNGGLISTGDDSGILNIQTNETTAITVDASQRIGIGTTSPSNILDIVSASNPTIRITDTTNNCYTELNATDTVGYVGTASNHAFGFTTNNSERMRIDTSGNLLVGQTSQTGNEKFGVTQSATGSSAVRFYASSASYTNDIVQISCARSGATTEYNAFTVFDNNTTLKMLIRPNGNLLNANNSYGSLSDISLKENIVDATPKLADLMQVKVRNYNLKSDPTHKQLGVIAQELEQVFPAMVEEATDKDEEGNHLETTTKSVKYSVFVPMLVKAIQELKAINDTQAETINALTARIVALETA